MYDGKSIAADRQVTAGSFIFGYQKKIQRWSKGYYAVSGRVQDVGVFHQWLEKKIRFKPSKSFSAFYTIGKTVYYIGDDLIAYKAFVPYALGDGSDVAEALARTGMSAKDVVKEMRRQCISVGGKIDVIDIR